MTPPESDLFPNSAADLGSALHDAFGFAELRAGQREAIEAVLDGIFSRFCIGK